MEMSLMKAAAGTSEVLVNSGDTMISIDDGFVGEGSYDGTSEGTIVDDMTGVETSVKDPLLSSWLFIGGISAIMLAVAVVLGILLAKKRIKKGYDLYEI